MNTQAHAAPASTDREPRFIPLWKAGIVVAHALVDYIDFVWLSAHLWYPREKAGVLYAARNEKRSERRLGRPAMIYMHREIMGLGRGEKRAVDHISKDTLDNRRSNLRACVHAENMQNIKGWDNATSSHRGVSWDKSRGKWKAQAVLAGKNTCIGRFATEQEAAEAAAAWRAEHMPFARD